jgi:hypothetical protein
MDANSMGLLLDCQFARDPPRRGRGTARTSAEAFGRAIIGQCREGAFRVVPRSPTC